MATLLDSIKSTIATSLGTHPPSDEAAPAHTPDLSSVPGGYQEDEPSGRRLPDDEPRLPAMKTEGLAGALHAPHKQYSLDALSTTAVKDEPMTDSGTHGDNPRGKEPQSQNGSYGQDSGRFSQIPSDASGPTLTPHPRGQPGAYDAQGQKYHEATDSQPGSFGIMGGAHLNSPDNQPHTAGTSSAVPELTEPDQGAQMAGILEPGPAMTRLPPTEPASSAPTPPPRHPTDVPKHGLNTQDSHMSTSTGEQGAACPTDSSEYPPPTAPQSDLTNLDATPAARMGSRDPTDGKHKEKVSVGDKIKGLVTEMKGVVKKDPEIKEQGRALRTGHAQAE